MSFLPIVERELRVAARKRNTTWFRLAAALAALVIGTGFLLMNAALGANSAGFGKGLFGTLTWLALACCLAAGMFFTADSISEEKREGTLGFLFLTDLRGYDVVGGKLLATSLRGFLALLAIFPILATSLLMGGVTGLQFWKSALALVNVLFCSLSVGLFVSAFCRDSQRAMAGTLFVLLLLCAGGPLADSIVRIGRGSGSGRILSYSSPVYVFWAASAWGQAGYWRGLATTQLLAWIGLAAACWHVPRNWQDRPARWSSSQRGFSYFLRYGAKSGRAARRKRLLSEHPVLWLALREQWQSMGAWVIAGVVLCVFVTIYSSLPAMAWVIWGQISWMIILVLYLWTSSHACRFFLDAKRSGLMELLLVTPLRGKDIVLGHWRALVRLFAVPGLMLTLVQFLGAVLGQQASMARVKAAASTYLYLPSLAYQVLLAASGSVVTIVNLAALSWFGMWMGLNSRNPNLATFRTILFVQVLPWLGITFISTTIGGLLMFRGFLSNSAPSNAVVLAFPAFIAGSSAVLALIKDAAFIAWARKRLFNEFRSDAARSAREGVLPIRMQSPPPVPIAPPPIQR